jgi:predicted small lipoprotein YifL
MKRIALALLVAALAGCGSSGAIRSAPDRGVVDDMQDARELDVLFLELETEQGRLVTLLSQQPVDCARACDLRASIQNIARKICSVTSRMKDRERDVQCVDARRRAEIAKTDVKEVCDCRSER